MKVNLLMSFHKMNILLYSKYFSGYVLYLITFALLTSCNQPIDEKVVWRLINPDTLSLDDAFWCDYYNENAVGPYFWQLEFLDTSLIEYKSYGFNVLHKANINYEINKDTLKLFYPRDYTFDKFTKSGRYLRLHTEKWLMQENNDTLTLSLISVIYTFSSKESFYDTKTAYKFAKPSNKLIFPDYLMNAPTNMREIIKIMNNLYSEDGKAQLIKHFDSIPDPDNYTSFGIRRTMIYSDLIKVFDITNNATLQELFDHYHPEYVAGGIIGIYLDYLGNAETLLKTDEK